MRVPLWEDGSLGEKFQHTSGAKDNLRLDALKRVRGTGSLYLCQPSPGVAQLSAKKDFLDADFSPMGKCEGL